MTGRWAAKHGGRFNRRGRETLYLSLSPFASIKEVMRNGRFEPILVVTVEAAVDGVVDAAASGIEEDRLAGDDWWWAVREKRLAPSQALAEELIESGASGLLVRSFAPTAGPEDMNLVLWRWSADSVRVVDAEGRLRPR